MNLHTCPVCGKKFLPAPEHIYKTCPSGRFVCGWNCLVKYRKKKERKKNNED